MQIYDENGFLNIAEIASAGAWLNVIIGARQVGKTFGTLLYHLQNDINHILLRRTTVELEMIGNSPELSPYKVFSPDYEISIERKGKYYTIEDKTNDKTIGMAFSLAQISHIRGFSGASYESIIFDEFIPEKGVVKRLTEGDALLNAYTTINGNRELQGKPPCKLWLLANSNDILSPILEALNLTKDVLSMRRKGKEYYYNRENGVIIVQPHSVDIVDKRVRTALMKQVREDSPFFGMAIKNDFSYDESPLIRTWNIKSMTPLFSFDETMFAWENDDIVYICGAKHNKNKYDNSQWSKEQLKTTYAWIIRAYAAELVYFSDMHQLALFKNAFNIDF